MRTLLALLLAGAVSALGQQTKPAPNPLQLAESYYAKGVAAEKIFDYAGAKAAYTAALRYNPQHPHSIFRLKQIEIEKDAMLAKGREAKLAKVILPVVRFDDATFQEAITALGAMVSKESNNQVTPNFIVVDPKSQFASIKIALNVKGLPATTVLKYLMDQARAKAKYDENAVVIEPQA